MLTTQPQDVSGCRRNRAKSVPCRTVRAENPMTGTVQITTALIIISAKPFGIPLFYSRVHFVRFYDV
jgi:hypothetical protein